MTSSLLPKLAYSRTNWWRVFRAVFTWLSKGIGFGFGFGLTTPFGWLVYLLWFWFYDSQVKTALSAGLHCILSSRLSCYKLTQWVTWVVHSLASVFLQSQSVVMFSSRSMSACGVFSFFVSYAYFVLRCLVFVLPSFIRHAESVHEFAMLLFPLGFLRYVLL